VASLTADDITYVDTTIVAVTPHSTVIKGLTLDLPNGTTLGLGDPAVSLVANAVDEHDMAIPGIAISIVSLDPNKIMLYAWGGPPSAQASALGKARIVVSTTSYGTTFVDTVQFTVQYGMAGNVGIQLGYPTNIPTFYPGALVIGVGGTASFFNGTSTPFSLTFLNGLENIVGSVTDLGPYGTQVVQFLAVGTYNYKDPVSGATGSIVVREQPTF
jgi:hypothetical protein